jgi:hypothetical protein
MRNSTILLALAGLTILPAPEADADTVPSAVCMVSTSSDACGNAAVTSVSISAPQASRGIGGSASWTFYYEVTDPNAASVSATVQYLLYAGAGRDFVNLVPVGQASAGAGATIETAGTPVTDHVSAKTGGTKTFDVSFTSPSPPALGADTADVTLATNTLYTISLSASSTAFNGGASAAAEAAVLVNTSLYPGAQVTVSSGVLNQIDVGAVTQLQPVPLPASAWLLMSALGGLCVLGSGRRPG